VGHRRNPEGTNYLVVVAPSCGKLYALAGRAAQAKACTSDGYAGNVLSEEPMCTSYQPNPHDRFDAYAAFEAPTFAELRPSVGRHRISRSAALNERFWPPG
jgi:hypothetical protein